MRRTFSVLILAPIVTSPRNWILPDTIVDIIIRKLFTIINPVFPNHNLRQNTSRKKLNVSKEDVFLLRVVLPSGPQDNERP